MIDFKTLKTQVEDDMARTDADFRYRRWCESNDIAWARHIRVSRLGMRF